MKTAKRIAVFDFDETGRTQAADAVRDCYARDGINIKVDAFGGIQEFAYSFKADPYDMAFITIDNMMGVEMARMIRDADAWCPLFLISGSGEYALEGYRLRALYYLVKPVTADGIAEAVRRIGMACLRSLQEPAGG